MFFNGRAILAYSLLNQDKLRKKKEKGWEGVFVASVLASSLTWVSAHKSVELSPQLKQFGQNTNRDTISCHPFTRALVSGYHCRQHWNTNIKVCGTSGLWNSGLVGRNHVSAMRIMQPY